MPKTGLLHQKRRQAHPPSEQGSKNSRAEAGKEIGGGEGKFSLLVKNLRGEKSLLQCQGKLHESENRGKRRTEGNKVYGGKGSQVDRGRGFVNREGKITDLQGTANKEKGILLNETRSMSKGRGEGAFH